MPIPGELEGDSSFDGDGGSDSEAPIIEPSFGICLPDGGGPPASGSCHEPPFNATYPLVGGNPTPTDYCYEGFAFIIPNYEDECLE